MSRSIGDKEKMKNVVVKERLKEDWEQKEHEKEVRMNEIEKKLMYKDTLDHQLKLISLQKK